MKFSSITVSVTIMQEGLGGWSEISEHTYTGITARAATSRAVKAALAGRTAPFYGHGTILHAA
jgi:hypothetical protein